ncbi:hypothetical protein B7494_g1831 [Chlorociboria aeruginascens]|nr:hypothetical protein B7494_g1831 [Chlorociboria aeruginascens]
MQSFEHTPMTSTKRSRGPLDVDTTYKGDPNDVSPPRTPRGQMSKANTTFANRALRAPDGTRETFLDDTTPVDSASKDHEPDRGREPRDSHDLSLNPRQVTRDSLVDNMLLSLDQFSFGQEDDGYGRTIDEARLYSSFGDDEPYQLNQNFAASRNGRGSHNYSYSSDYDNGDDSSRYSDKLSRGRRSNSSSNFQSNLGRINSIRNDMGSGQGFIKGPSIPPRVHSRNGIGSKGGSSANSVDLGYAQATNNQRWAHGLVGRSSSFDYATERQTISSQSHTMGRQLNSDPPTFSPYDYDAAPTPTVPVGPRRFPPPSPILSQHDRIPSNPPPPKLEHKRSTRSSKSAYKSKASLNSSAARFELNDRRRELPPLPAFIKDHAPAPFVGYGKSRENSQGSVPLTKEKPSFFRRVFGSSKNNSVPPAPEPSRSHDSATSTETSDRPTSKPHHIASQLKTQAAPPSREPPPTPKEQPHVLTKKPSSFFRRRKKSVSEPESAPPPVVQPIRLHPEKEKLILKPEASPVSSLRKVMNPYLRSPVRTTMDAQPTRYSPELNDTGSSEDRQVRGFSPDYTPDKNATIRAVKPGSHDMTSAPESHTSTPKSPEISKPHLVIPMGLDGQTREDKDTAFLQDHSDNDPVAHSNISKSAIVTKDEATANYSPSLVSPSLSVARDMALVAEYERIHSQRSPTTPKFDAAKDERALDSPKSAVGSSSSQTQPTAILRDGEWVMITPVKSSFPSDKENRVWLESSSSEENLAPSKLPLPPRTADPSIKTSTSTETAYKSATSLPTVQIDGVDAPSSPPRVDESEAVQSTNKPLPAVQVARPTEDDCEKAKKLYDGDEDFMQKEKAAAWMGEEDPTRSMILIAYMELYEFVNLNILAALRNLCARLVLRAESQQVDRILDAFAKRWCQCNPDHGFKVTDVVHTICYSLLLLNTDLHLADIDQKMTRSQFVKNTMPTVRKSVADSAPDAFEPNRPTILPGKSHTFTPDSTITGPKPGDSSTKLEKISIEVERPSWRSSFKPPPRTDSGGLIGNLPTPLDYDTPADDCGPLVKSPFNGTLRTWEVQVEIVLKDFYNSIRAEKLPLFGATIEKSGLQGASSNSLAVFTNGMLRRTPSVLSKTPSESQSFARGRTADTVRTGGKWSNKNRSRPRLYPNSVMGSSHTSLDDQSSMWSPSVSSSTWSKYSLGKTQTSMSVDSLGSSWPQGDYQQSIGFANALSQAIIREETVGSSGSNGPEYEELRVAPLLEDESLELAGAPWAKEGILKHKHHLETLDRKAKDRNWVETFAVIEKGYMSLFSFSTKSIRNKSKSKGSGAVVGGGNWQENAENLGSFLLRQTIASALPSPGYSKARPHVWALSLPTGAVHLFQVGTPDIVKEFVSTANYWSARLSNHPLVGGVSNIEYGWSDSIINNALVTAINESQGSRPSTGGRRPSLQNSLRSSLDQGYGGNVRSRLPGDKITISDWTPPAQSMRASNLMEADQLTTLTAYVTSIEEELQKHNQLRSPMLLAFSPRHTNAQKAMANWEKKSSYLLREIVKFRTYIDSLHAAQAGKQRIYAERAAENVFVEKDDEGSGDDDDADETLRPE